MTLESKQTLGEIANDITDSFTAYSIITPTKYQ